MAKSRRDEYRVTKPTMYAWERPIDWQPADPCRDCDGTGMGANKTYNHDALTDWDNCNRCGGTGEEPK